MSLLPTVVQQQVDYYTQEIYAKKDGRHCEGCGQTLPVKLVKKMKASPPGSQFLCKSCTRVCITCLPWKNFF